MSQREQVVIEIEDSPSPPVRHVLQRISDTRFITPSEESDTEPEVTWGMRKQRNDKGTLNTLKSNNAPPSTTARGNVKPSTTSKSSVSTTSKPSVSTTPKPSIRPSTTPKASVRPSTTPKLNGQPLPPHLVPAQQQQPVQPRQHRPHQPQPQPRPQPQPQQYNSVSIANPATQAWFAALSKSGESGPSTTAPILPPGARLNHPLSLSRPQPSVPAAPDRSPRPYALTSTTRLGSTGPAASQPVQPTKPLKKPSFAPRPTGTTPTQHTRDATPISSTSPRAPSKDVPKENNKSRGHPQEVFSSSKKVASPTAPSSGQTVVNPKSSSAAAELSSPRPLSRLQTASQRRKEPVTLHTSPKMPSSLLDPPSSPAESSPAKQLSPRKPLLQSSVIEIDSSSDDDSMGAAASLETSVKSSTPRVGKRKLAAVLDHDEPVKRFRPTRSSAHQSESSTPSINPVVSQNDVVRSVEAELQQQFTFPTDLSKIRPFANRFGQQFTTEEDALIIHLKENVTIPWKDFERFFPGRKWPSMQTRYSKVLSKRDKKTAAASSLTQHGVRKEVPYAVRELRRTTFAQANSVDSSTASQEREEEAETVDDPNRCRRSVRPLNNLVRHRELGSTLGREWPRKFQAGLKDLVYSSMGAQAYMDNASGDVSTIAWSPDGGSFAAGAVALTDIQSIDYNKPRNLVIGSAATQKAKELPQHTIKHRLPDGRQKELFSTVQAVAFSPDSNYMYSIGIDRHLHKYKINGSPLATTLVCRREHPASVDFLSVSIGGLVATGNASSGPDAIQVYSHNDEELAGPVTFSSMQQANRTPSALRWGIAHQHQDYLLAGFSKEAEVVYEEDDHRDKEGEVGLWDIRTQQRIETDAPNRNVFDLAWNPNPSGDSSIFAVASRPVSHVGYGIHSVVRLYSPQQTRAQHTMELDCPAWDINDVVYSPHDNNLIAVGSTEGRVHIWDVRYAKHGQQPLRTLKHGESLAVMRHGKKRWEVDTGIRFLSWGSERDRLYTGSSDGVVACWDPYRSDPDKHVRDVVQLNSAVMSGAFSPDFSRLLIGEDAARLNLLSVGNDGARFNRITTPIFSVEKAPLKIEEVDPAPIPWDCQKMLEAQALEIKPAGTMPFKQVVQGPKYNGPFCLTEETARKALKEATSEPARDEIRALFKEVTKNRNESEKFQDRAHMSLRRRKKQTRKSGLRPTHPCDLDCGFIPLPDNYLPEEVWLSKTIPDPSSDWIKKRDAICFRCGNKARLSKDARELVCNHCGTAWKVGALGYEVFKQIKRTTRSEIVQGETSNNVLDLCDSEDERDRFIREVSASSTDSDSE
ncbi:WD40 repeat-like protein [Aureobasidium sp. EXF-8845]|nr:WD40 repeat-like protein [Aureobasidium sp. EXF-8845]KAI4854314.1 WD40 repeat-like protein [Aureobasidium sp. EXF-8846]